jgi:hypothetical protein
MSTLLLNLDDLNSHHDKLEENRIKLYDEILASCHRKINKYNKEFRRQECLFIPPKVKFGKPLYNYVDLVNYLINSLRNNGVLAEWLPEKQAIYVSWKKCDVDMKKYREHYTNTIYTCENLNVTTPHFSVMKVRPTAVEEPKKRGKKNSKPTIQHVAMLEYNPGATDYIPINIAGIPH